MNIRALVKKIKLDPVPCEVPTREEGVTLLPGMEYSISLDPAQGTITVKAYGASFVNSDGSITVVTKVAKEDGRWILGS